MGDIAGVGQDRTASGYTATQPTDFPRRVARGLDPEDRCADGWENIHRGCYRFTVDPQLGWEDALMDCQGRGGELISVSDMGEKPYFLLIGFSGFSYSSNSPVSTTQR
ncbi:uncharacterized protein [Littorina saxatilis]|uniref:uncharacterized protein n=1 Tax=Littorina saxatilis TaxID=31220 RepID=UPI0038B4BA6A